MVHPQHDYTLGSGNIVEKEVERLQEPEAQEVNWETVSFRYNKETASMKFNTTAA